MRDRTSRSPSPAYSIVSARRSRTALRMMSAGLSSPDALGTVELLPFHKAAKRSASAAPSGSSASATWIASCSSGDSLTGRRNGPPLEIETWSPCCQIRSDKSQSVLARSSSSVSVNGCRR